MLDEGLYGAPPAALIEVDSARVQFSPLVPGSAALEDQAPGTLSSMIMAAPPGTLERRYALAGALRALAPGAPLTVLAPKDRGGSRLRRELERFGCAVSETAKQHHRICLCRRAKQVPGLDQALAEGGLRRVEALGLWSQPGVFSWDRPDPGTQMLIGQLPDFSGEGADLGCGLGGLSLAVLRSPAVRRVHLVDLDRRAMSAARLNVVDPRAAPAWRDLRAQHNADLLGALDFVVMNPPFHDGGRQDASLGLAFIARAAEMLRPRGSCWLVANRRLPYEAPLRAAFARVTLKAEASGFKIYEARK